MSPNPAAATVPCAVFFCGTPGISPGFDAFFANARKLSSVVAAQVPDPSQLVEIAKEADRAVAILLFSDKTESAPILNAMTALYPAIKQGTLRVLTYGSIKNEKLIAAIDLRGCSEILGAALTQKSLVHKLQKHLQLVETRFQARAQRTRPGGRAVMLKGTGPAKPAKAVEGTLKFIEPLTETDDCWLVKSKRDFNYVRGQWIGALIGPGPSVGSWADAGGTAKDPVFRWSPREKSESNPFISENGTWYCVGKRPEFDWKSNRWLFVGEAPSLYYQAAGTEEQIFRFRPTGVAVLEVCLNSTAAKNKLKAIIDTFAAEKLVKHEKNQSTWGDNRESASDDEETSEPEDTEQLEFDEPASEAPVEEPVQEEEDSGLDELLGTVAGENEWETGADAFDQITLDMTLRREDVPGAPATTDVVVLERREGELLLDAPAQTFKVGERVSFAVSIGQKGGNKSLSLSGVLKGKAPSGEAREAILVSVADISRPQLIEIEKAFEVRQKYLLRFLMEAKG